MLSAAAATAPCPDGELLRAIARGEVDPAMAELCRRHGDWVYAVARRLVRDPALAGDCAQATFILLWQKARSLAGADDRAIVAWLFRTARYQCANALRGQRRRRQREQEVAMSHPDAAHRATAATNTLQHDLLDQLDTALGSLPRTDQSALLLRFYRQLSLAAVGAALGTSEEGARKRVARAIARLRDALAGRGLAVAPATLGTVMGEAVVQPAPAGLFAGPASPTATALAQQSTAAWSASAFKLIAGGIAVAAVALGLILTLLAQTTAIQPATPPVQGPQAAVVQPRPVSGFAGRLLRPDGQPLAAAKVTAVNGGSYKDVIAAPPVTTGADGTFAIPEPAWLAPEERNWLRVIIESDEFGLSAASLRRDFDTIFRVPEPGELIIPLVDPAGQPAAGLRVHARLVNVGTIKDHAFTAAVFLPDAVRQRWSAVSDAQGIARLPGMPGGGSVHLGFDDPRYLSIVSTSVQTEVMERPRTRLEPFTVRPAATIRGRVLGLDGQPLADARVVAQATTPQRGSGGYAETTGADGRFELPQLTTATYRLGVQVLPEALRGKATSPIVETAVGEGATIDVGDLQLIPGELITGRVVSSADGKPVETSVGVMVPGMPVGQWQNGLLHTVRTDADGRFASRVPAGPVYVYISDTLLAFDRPDPEGQLVQVQPGERASVEIKLTPKPGVAREQSKGEVQMIKGVVLDADGNPVPYARVIGRAMEGRVRRPMGDLGAPSAVADAQGRFELPAVEMPVRLIARGSVGGEPIATIEPLQIDQPDEVPTLRLSRDGVYRLRVRVIDAETGEPVPNAEVSVTRQLPGGYGSGIGGRSTADENGEYVVSGLLSDADYRVSTTHDGRSYVGSVSIQKRPGQAEVQVTVKRPQQRPDDDEDR